MISYIAIAITSLLVFSNLATWHYTSKHEGAKLAAFKADVAAKGKAKESENARVQAAANAAATEAGLAVRSAEARARAAEEERRAAMARVGGLVRDLAAARRVLDPSASPSGTATPARIALRDHAGDTGADIAGRLNTCHADLTVLTDTMSVNRLNHERALIARAACVAFYNNVARHYNEREP